MQWTYLMRREAAVMAVMAESRLERLARRLNRRRKVTGLGGGLLLGLLDSEVTASKKKKVKSCPPCKRRKQGTCKGTQPDGTACAGGACQRGRCLAAQAGLPATQPSARLVYQCPGPSEGPLFGSGSDRYAHTFIPGQSESLRQIAFGIMKEGTAGDYVVQLL